MKRQRKSLRLISRFMRLVVGRSKIKESFYGTQKLIDGVKLLKPVGIIPVVSVEEGHG